MTIQIRTQGLPDGSFSECEFEFHLTDTMVMIPGEQRGPDVCIPDSDAQKIWLDKQSDLLKPYWDCKWEFLELDNASILRDRIESGNCRVLSIG